MRTWSRSIVRRSSRLVLPSAALALAACSLSLGDEFTRGDASGGGGADRADGEARETSEASVSPPNSGDAGAEDSAADALAVAGLEINGGFEAAGLACGPGWENDSGASLSRATSPDVHSGTSACRICGAGGGQGIVRYLGQTKGGPGQYEIDIVFRSETADGPGYFALFAEQFAGGPATQVGYVSRGPTNDLDWHTMQLLFTVDPGNKPYRFVWYFDDGPSKCALVDDVRVLYAP